LNPASYTQQDMTGQISLCSSSCELLKCINAVITKHLNASAPVRMHGELQAQLGPTAQHCELLSVPFTGKPGTSHIQQH